MTPIERKIQQLRNDGEDEFADLIENWRNRTELWRIADSALEDINEVMWESYMVKDREFGRNEGAKIMAALNRWCTSEADKQKQAAPTRRQARP